MSEGNVDRKFGVSSRVSVNVESGARVIMAAGTITMGANMVTVVYMSPGEALT